MVSYGTPASPDLCKGICGEEYKHLVKELNRLVLINNIKNEASLLIGKSLKLLKKLKYPILEYPKFQNKNYKTDTNIPTQRLLI